MIRLHLLALGLTCVVGCAEQPAKTQAKWTPVPASPTELVEISRIQATGREIYRQDQLAWHGSDALAQTGLREKAGWIVTRIDDTDAVVVISGDGSSLQHVADVLMPNGAQPHVDIHPSRPLSDTERLMYRARETAIAHAKNICNGAINTAILPADGGAWDVFVLAASSNIHIVPMGGHSRVRVSADVSTVLAIEPYSKTCINMDDSAPGTVMLMASHIVSDLPAPTHVFLSLTYPKPIILATKTHLWRVADGAIVAVDN